MGNLRNDTPEIIEMKKYISNFHYLTQDQIPNFSVLEQVKMACEAGAKWIQYRVFPKPLEEWVDEVNIASQYCDDWGVTLSVNDSVEVALLAHDVQGVHLGMSDMDPIVAREKLGEDKVIGGSALSLEDVKFFHHAKVDYISIGPFHFTNTKKISIDPLGFNGIQTFIKQINSAIPDFDIPLIIAGGIQIKDMSEIKKLPIHGVAISSAINLAVNPKEAFKSFYNQLY